MATIIEQAPLSSPDYNRTPVGQNIMFAVSNNLIVANQIKVKFVAEVHISSYLPPVPGTTTHLVGTFKTTPNNAGVGMFDFRPIIESHVKADNLARFSPTAFAEYKGIDVSASRRPPLHLIDKFSGNDNTMRYLFINFKVEYLDQTTNQLIQVQAAPSESYKIFNGYLKYTDKLDQVGVNFGYSTVPFVLGYSSSSFLTNASTTQYANITDYGTVSMMNMSVALKVTLTYYNSAGGSLGSESVVRNANNGAPKYWDADIAYEILHFGCYPANLRNWSSTFQGIVSTISYYTVQAQSIGGSAYSDTYTINVNCPTLKGYEPIRLTWLNQWGAWDYYTFTMKSSRMLSTKGSTYNQLAGTWNEAAYRIDSFKGGKKAFRVNATEKITMNTDFVNEAESQWFEDLINSPEVYILEGFEDITETTSALNQYVIPARLTTSSYTRKTVANDKLMQYTFEVEKSKTLRTQSV